MVKECMLSSDNLPLGGLPRNSMVRITDRPDMTSAVYVDIKKRKSNQQSVDLELFVNMSLVVRKPVFGVSDQVAHKPG